MSEADYPYDTRRVSELLKHKRKTRGIKSCFPCRHRKVRCDGHVPCATCMKRGHAELCRVPTLASARQSRLEGQIQVDNDDAAALPARVVRSQSPLQEDCQPFGNNEGQGPDPVGQGPAGLEYQPTLHDVLSRVEKLQDQILDLRQMLRHTDALPAPPAPDPHLAGSSAVSQSRAPAPSSKSPGRHVVEDATGATIFLGSHSDAPLALGCREAGSSGLGDSVLDDALMAQFVPRAYPFTSLWRPDASTKDISRTLPDDSDVIRYWQAYQSTAYPFYPVLIDVDAFGLSVFDFLNTRGSGQGTEPDLSWLALLFAVLACGAQFTHDPVQERDLRSKVFTCSSFHCLRMSNFFYHTNLEQIQAMALICHCLRNNLDTNTAWILMGTTIRLGQSIGLHEVSSTLPAEDQLQRSRLWWMLVWQDAFLSFTYDRPPSCSATESCPIPRMSESTGLSFQECVFRICHILLNVKAKRGDTIAGYKAQLEGILREANPSLTNRTNCRSLQDHLERLALGIHLGYSICRITQMQLDSSPKNSPDIQILATDCYRRAAQVVENFLELHRLSNTVCRSWAFVHNAVSCAITMHNLAHLAVASEIPTVADPSTLARRLTTLLETEARASEWYDADTNVRYFGPYSRALKALKEIYGEHI
ncbi:hypothetical protein BDW74DRAFT_182198 [Aspergillus multicolor]|uniref:Zn(II)2Cys6 transcription factor n=1 Tax=Aspergillus multicolor TaxID=41759 RepID=UPI003CCCA701